MANYREIVTKAIVGKGKKHFSTTNSVTPEIEPTTILGCWVINHSFKGYTIGDKVVIDGNFDINIWYSYDNDKKITYTLTYENVDTYKSGKALVIDFKKTISVKYDESDEVIFDSII